MRLISLAAAILFTASMTVRVTADDAKPAGDAADVRNEVWGYSLSGRGLHDDPTFGGAIVAFDAASEEDGQNDDAVNHCHIVLWLDTEKRLEADLNVLDGFVGGGV